jgi:hypothetical protein
MEVAISPPSVKPLKHRQTKEEGTDIFEPKVMGDVSALHAANKQPLFALADFFGANPTHSPREQIYKTLGWWTTRLMRRKLPIQSRNTRTGALAATEAARACG